MVTLFHKGRDVWVDVSFKSVFARVDRSSYILSLPKVCFSPSDLARYGLTSLRSLRTQETTDVQDFTRPPKLQYRL